MKLQINITKKILSRAMFCGTALATGATSENCAIALAVRDLFPQAIVTTDTIYYMCINANSLLPTEARAFIEVFDDLVEIPENRLNLEEFSFEINVPEEVIDSIGLEQVHAILENHTTMQLITS
jgi:hypothetical protein